MDTKKNSNKFFFHLAIMLIVMIGFRFLPLAGQITPEGMQIAGIFISVIYGWVTIGLLVPSLLGILAVGLTNLITTTDFFSAGFGSQTFVLIIGMMVIAAFISQSNLSQLIIKTMMSLKIAKGRPWIILLCFLYADFAVASVSNSLVSALLFVPLYIQMAQTANIPDYAKLNNAMIVGIAFAGLMGDITFPFQITAVMIASTFTSATGIAVDLGRYLIAFLPWSLFMIAAYIAICKFIFRIDASPLVLVDTNYGNERASKRQIIALGFVLFTVILLVLPNFLPAGLPVTQILKTLGSGGCVLLALFLMAVVHVDGQPLLDIGKTAQGISWDMLFMAAYFAPTASLLTSDATGIKATISTMLQPFLSNLPPVCVIIAIAIIGVALTNMLNNMVVAVVLISMISILGDFLVDFNLLTLMCIVLFCCNIAYILPSACPTSAYLYSQKELIQFKTQFPYALLVGIIMLVLTLTVGMVWFNIIW